MAKRGCSSRQVVEKFGGASRDRTDDLIVANDALSQLSYSPTRAWCGTSILAAVKAWDKAHGCSIQCRLRFGRLLFRGLLLSRYDDAGVSDHHIPVTRNVSGRRIFDEFGGSSA
jgi:hypothetical protein